MLVWPQPVGACETEEPMSGVPARWQRQGQEVVGERPKGGGQQCCRCFCPSHRLKPAGAGGSGDREALQLVSDAVLPPWLPLTLAAFQLPLCQV